MEILEYLREINIASIIVRLTLATLCGGIIGIERGRKRRPAGFRTHILVCIGATVTMITNQYVVEVMGQAADPTRLGAQVISGIGFLGAGTILVTGKQQVKGLTTAAGLWSLACIGLAIGIGFYEVAILGCLFIFGGMSILHKLDNYIMTKARVMEFYIELDSIEGMTHLIQFIKENEMQVSCVEVVKDMLENKIGILITLKQKVKIKHEDVITILMGVEEVVYVEEV